VSLPPLSTNPDLDEALRKVLLPALDWIRNSASDFRPRVILLMGSSSCGEANGVLHDGRLLPLSDLDVGIFVDRMGTLRELNRFREALAAEMAPIAREAGLAHNPVDAGFISLPELVRMPATLEMCEAARRPCVLDGDANALRPLIKTDPAPFEGIRLVFNRVAEMMMARPSADESWPHVPGVEDWRRAHVTSKMVLDFCKAFMAIHGNLEPSIKRRMEHMQRPLCEQSVPDAAGLLSLIGWWATWRLSPSWPPPQVDGTELARLAERVLIDGARASGLARFSLGEAETWKQLLACEGGPGRERLRRWSRMIKTRPIGCSWAGALGFARSWGTSVWPGSLAALLICLYWTETYLRAGLKGTRTGELWSATLTSTPGDVGEAIDRLLPAYLSEQERPAASHPRPLRKMTGLYRWVQQVGG